MLVEQQQHVESDPCLKKEEFLRLLYHHLMSIITVCCRSRELFLYADFRLYTLVRERDADCAPVLTPLG